MLKKIWIGIAVVVAAIVVVAVMTKKREHASGQIVIGHIGPLTGDAAIFGNWEKDGIDLAVDEINVAGGIDGRRLVVIHEDDKGEAAVSVSAAQSLISTRGVRIIISTLSSPTLAIAPIARKNDVVLLTPSAQSPKISEAGVFRLFASSTVEGAHLVDLVVKSGAKTVAILYLNNDYGVGLEKVVSEKLKGRVDVVASEAYASDTRDYKTQIQKAVVSTKPEAVLLLGFPTDMGTILKQMGELNVTTRVFAPNGFEGEEIVKIAGKAADGVVYVYPVLSDAQYTAKVKAAFRARYGRDMNVYNGMGYDTIQVLVAAMRDCLAHSRNPYGDQLKEALHALKDFPGITGPITFDKNGDIVDRPMEARIVKDGKFVRLED